MAQRSIHLSRIYHIGMPDWGINRRQNVQIERLRLMLLILLRFYLTRKPNQFVTFTKLV